MIQGSPTQSNFDGSPDGKSRNPNGKMTQDSIRPNSSQNQLQQQARLMQKNGAGNDGEDDGNAQIYRSLQGLVKLQALVRGIRDRKRVAKLLAIQRKKNEAELNMKSKLISSSIQKHTASNSVLRSISHKSSEQQQIRPASFREKRKD